MAGPKRNAYAAAPMDPETHPQEDSVYLEEDDWLLPTSLAQGPWNPEHQNGGAVAGILARAVDAIEAPSPMRIARLSIDLMRPVPMRPLKPRVQVVRAGRRIQVVDAWLENDGVPVARTSALRIRSDESLAPGDAYSFPFTPPARPGPGSERPVTRRKLGYVPGWLRAVDFRREQLSQPGQKNRAWVRLRKDLVSGEPTRPIVQLAALSDFSAGIANPLDFSEWTSPNADLTLHILREPQSRWLALEGICAIAHDGLGQSSATIFDEKGVCARGQASLLVDRSPDS